ncbi:hypothetical protein R1T16_09635 [Flavobacterium sp. DG1-102-2]|uniref:hypothetical protein n=1 Tax=Flavobacterium sp. DG1-102-2 TaxID=3081663 RepID=UPI002948DFB4|nr:hypothetical protein [Flavobacterium sp. DG1-102-2]MDV6168685.1 hypothetical protein [Flavobacterium sp. DG1-102-2]
MKNAFKIILLALCVSFSIIACKDKQNQNVKAKKYYFDFDVVEYYITDKGFKDLAVNYNKKNKTLKDKVTLKIMSSFDQPVSYETAIKNLESIGFKKVVIPVSKHDVLRSIFTEKPSKRTESVACEPIYRDIYVFRKNGKVSGIAKLCYECGLSDFIGTKADTDNFGMD